MKLCRGGEAYGQEGKEERQGKGQEERRVAPSKWNGGLAERPRFLTPIF